LNGTHLLLKHACDFHILGEHMNTIERNRSCVRGKWEVSLNVNTEKTKYMVVYRQQNIRQYHSLLIANTSFVYVTKFKHLVTTVTNQNYIHEEIRSK